MEELLYKRSDDVYYRVKVLTAEDVGAKKYEHNNPGTGWVLIELPNEEKQQMWVSENTLCEIPYLLSDRRP